MKKVLSFLLSIVLILSVVFCVPFTASSEIKTLKVLAIGNSFSVDAMEHLYGIAANAGYTNIVLGNLYQGGCSLASHVYNIKNSVTYEYYYKNTTGTWKATPKTHTVLDALKEERWDIVSLQQASPDSGMVNTYNEDIDYIVNYVRANVSNPDIRFVWHMTWAYQQDTTHWAFANYNNDQQTMYNSITSAVQTKIIPNANFRRVIPSGTAIQNARTSYIGDTLTRDGYHLTYTLGRYIAALTWFKALTSESIDNITYVPDKKVITDKILAIAKDSVNNALQNPFKITDSKYKVDLSIYEEFDWAPTPCAYWYPAGGTSHFFGDSNAKLFVCSRQRYTKEDIPVGSIIQVDKGYQYRPDNWLDVRPDMVTDSEIIVDEAWWNGVTYRSFNVSKTDLSDITSCADEVAKHFRIYVPKKIHEEEYHEFDWQPQADSYWFYYDSDDLIRNNPTSVYYLASGKRYTKNDIPPGSIIEINPGYQYRPEAWTLPVRVENVSTFRTIVTDEWWDNVSYRAFNVSTILLADIRNKADIVAKNFKIYVPHNYHHKFDNTCNGCDYTRRLEINSNDIVGLRKILLGTYEKLNESDVNSDGMVDVRDLVRLKRLSAKQK